MSQEYRAMQQAIVFLRKAVTANTKYLATYQNHATYLFARGNKTKAINTLLRTISEGIADESVYSASGGLYIGQKWYDRAIMFLRNI